MKTKTLNKKLVLSKSTIANLNDEEKKNVNGGAITTSENTLCPIICRSFKSMCC